MTSTTGSVKSAAHSNYGLNRSSALSTERRHRMSSRCGRRALHEPAGYAKLHRMAAALVRAGLDKEATFYALRHSYISRAIEGEVPLNIIGDNCGTSIRIIETTYAKVLAGKRREFIERGAPSLERP